MQISSACFFSFTRREKNFFSTRRSTMASLLIRFDGARSDRMDRHMQDDLNTGCLNHWGVLLDGIGWWELKTLDPVVCVPFFFLFFFVFLCCCLIDVIWISRLKGITLCQTLLKGYRYNVTLSEAVIDEELKALVRGDCVVLGAVKIDGEKKKKKRKRGDRGLTG